MPRRKHRRMLSTNIHRNDPPPIVPEHVAEQQIAYLRALAQRDPISELFNDPPRGWSALEQRETA